MRTTRLAPSPTGALHLGNARTFLWTWAWARASSSALLFRMEDLDSPRRKPGASEGVILDLRWLGIDWDGEVVVQSQRGDAHQAAFARLYAAGLLYPCTCTRADVENSASAPHGESELSYPGTCRNRYSSLVEAQVGRTKPVAVRFRVPEGVVTFEDDILGTCAINPALVGGDFVVARAASHGTLDIAYQLAVVVDDAAMGVDFVIRGDDLLSSVPRQRLLQRALGLPEVKYAHLPLVIGPDGRRLAKRHGDTRVAAYREAGITSARIRMWAAESLGLAAGALENPRRGTFDAGLLPRDQVIVPAHEIRSGPPPPTWRGR